MQVYCISQVDNTRYSNLNGMKIISNQANQYGYHNEYYFTEPREVIVGYMHVYQVVWHNFTIATIACVPRDSKKNVRGCAIKMANAVLYTQSWYYLMNDLAGALGWTIHNLTRIDLCADFNYFWHGLHPQTLIRKYVKKNANGYIKIGTNKFACNGTRTEDTAIIDTLRFGSRQSGVSTYLYNKSKELSEKHDKPWIRKCWEEVHLNEDDVWRLEFSIGNSATELREIQTGMLHTLFHTDFELNDAVRVYFLAYASRYFQFKHIERMSDGITFQRRSRMRDVELFDPSVMPTMKPVSQSRARDTGRTEKILSNRLAQEYEFVMMTDDANKYQTAQSITNLRKHLDDLYTLKKQAARQELGAVQAVRKFSESYLRERLKLRYMTAKDYRVISDVAKTFASDENVKSIIEQIRANSSNIFLQTNLNNFNHDYKNFEDSTTEGESVPVKSNAEDRVI